MSSQPIALEMQNVSKRFNSSDFKWFKRSKKTVGVLAVNDVSVQVYRSEIFGVLPTWLQVFTQYSPATYVLEGTPPRY